MGDVDLPFEYAILDLNDRLVPLMTEITKRATKTVESLNVFMAAFGNNRQQPERLPNYSCSSIVELSQQLSSASVDYSRVLFRSWFVDFEPVFLKSQGNKPRVADDIAELFPSGFEDSELGEIPKGWRVGTYAEILVPVNTRIGDEVAPEYSATVRGLELRELRFNKQLSQAQTKNKKIVKNDLVFGLSRKVINFGLMTSDIGSVSPVYEIFHIKTDVYIPELLELYIRYHMRMHVDILKSGAREGSPIDREYLLTKEILIPDYRVQKAFRLIIKGE